MTVCEEYGRALYTLAVQTHGQEAMYETLCGMKTVFRRNPAYEKLLDTPAVPTEEKLALLDKAFGDLKNGDLPAQYALNFLKILCEKHIVYAFDSCVEAYRKQYYAEIGIEEAVCLTAAPMTDTQMTAMRQKLENMTGKRIELINRVDPSLIGGVVLQMEGKQLDGSIRSSLEAFRRQLARSVL